VVVRSQVSIDYYVHVATNRSIWLQIHHQVRHIPAHSLRKLTPLKSDLNVNSAIAKPDHDETISVPQPDEGAQQVYPIRGYAYAGGGRRVNRVEVSLDEGQTWSLAEM
jgi:nitrate reductase (NAD(P)H)